MNNRQGILSCLCMLGVIAIALVAVRAYKQDKHSDGLNPPPFPFEVITEGTSKSLSTTTVSVEILLAPQYYSRQNLDRLFGHYSKKYPNKENKLQVFVYTNREKLERARRTPARFTTVFPSQPVEVLFDASFYRANPGGTVGHINEWYRYRPEPNRPDAEKVVAIRGRPPTGEQRVIETWETAKDGIKLRAIAYELKDVEPSGTYYTFESVNEAFLLGARAILTFRQDEQLAIPRDQIRIVNDRIAYIFMGWMYGVTTDAGHTWSVWDAGQDLQDWRCCEGSLIEEVHITPDGKGLMTIKPAILKDKEIRKLYTNDYGRHWNVDQR